MAQTIKSQQTFMNMEEHLSSVEIYIADKGTKEEFTEALLEKAKKYIEAEFSVSKGEGLVDAWGNPYEFKKLGANYTLASMGKDGKKGTKDDVSLTMEFDGDQAEYKQSYDPESYAKESGGSFLWLFLLIGFLSMLSYGLYIRKK